MTAPVGRRLFTFAHRRMSTLSKSVQTQIAQKYKVNKTPPLSTSLTDILSANKNVLNQEIKFHANEINKANEQLQHIRELQKEISSCVDKVMEIFERINAPKNI